MYTQEEVEQQTAELRSKLGDNITWKYEARYDVMLSEFAQNKSDGVFESLAPLFKFQWDYRSAKKLPKVLKDELRDLARVSKNQKLLLIPKQGDTPAIVAFWWPWGHGGTYSLRLKILESNISDVDLVKEESGFLRRLFNWIKK